MNKRNKTKQALKCNFETGYPELMNMIFLDFILSVVLCVVFLDRQPKDIDLVFDNEKAGAKSIAKANIAKVMV